MIGKLFVNTRNFIDGSVNEMHDLELLETACIFWLNDKTTNEQILYLSMINHEELSKKSECVDIQIIDIVNYKWYVET